VEGDELGSDDGSMLGSDDGSMVGSDDGMELGAAEGAELGCPVDLTSKLSSPLNTLGRWTVVGSPLKRAPIPAPS
jgi:hypothetical protein